MLAALTKPNNARSQPPATQLLDASGKVVAQLAKADTSKMFVSLPPLQCLSL
jgi:hypothetical protein